MEMVTLGKTGITVNKNGFGALPIQRISIDDAVALARRAYEAGMTFFDTARFYTDSEEKLGEAFDGMREKVCIATKTAAQNAEDFWKDLEVSLHNLRTDYIDIYQFHNPSFCPKPGDGTGLYEAMLEAKAQGKIRHIGITNHRLAVANEAIDSGLYETLQFPFCYLATEKDLELVKKCKEADMGFIAMKALSGGLINNSAAAYAFEAQYDNVLPIWGVQRKSELEEFISYIDNPPVMNDEIKALIGHDRKELSGEFCRGCGYCMPCPAGIEINNCARMSLMLRRAPSDAQLTPEMQAKMKKIENCLHCNKCKSKCPYGLDTPALLQKNYEDYKRVLAGEVSVTAMKKTTVVFDLDGTLLDTLQDLANAVNYALEQQGMPKRTLEEVRQFVGNGVRLLMIRAVPDGENNPLFEETFALFKDYYGEHCNDNTKPYAGVVELIETLKEKGYAVAIVSNKIDFAVKELNDLYFKGIVPVAIGEKEGIRRKPAPDTVFEALKELGKTKEEAVYVGDSDVDIETAKNAGMPCVSVLWGFRDKEFLAEHGAEYYAETAEDVLRFVEAMEN